MSDEFEQQVASEIEEQRREVLNFLQGKIVSFEVYKKWRDVFEFFFPQYVLNHMYVRNDVEKKVLVQVELALSNPNKITSFSIIDDWYTIAA